LALSADEKTVEDFFLKDQKSKDHWISTVYPSTGTGKS